MAGTAAIASSFAGTLRVPDFEAQVFRNWFAATAMLLTRYCDIEADDDPFAYNETASVSALVGSATLAGYVGLAEYGAGKRGATNHRTGKLDGRMRFDGRADFYLACPDHGWEIEFKTDFPLSSGDCFDAKMAAALACTDQSVVNSGVIAVAGLIVPLWYHAKAIDRAKLIATGEKLARACHHAWLIEIPETRNQTMFFFKKKSR